MNLQIPLNLHLRYNIPMSKERNARPWDLFNKKIGRVAQEKAQERLSICKECPFFFGATRQCTKCGCFMPEKVKLSNAFCPIHKWEKEE
jgi:hypothetical protein